MGPCQEAMPEEREFSLPPTLLFSSTVFSIICTRLQGAGAAGAATDVVLRTLHGPTGLPSSSSGSAVPRANTSSIMAEMSQVERFFGVRWADLSFGAENGDKEC